MTNPLLTVLLAVFSMQKSAARKNGLRSSGREADPPVASKWKLQVGRFPGWAKLPGL